MAQSGAPSADDSAALCSPPPCLFHGPFLKQIFPRPQLFPGLQTAEFKNNTAPPASIGPHRRVLFPGTISAISNGFRRAGTKREPEGLPCQGNRYRTDSGGDFTSPAFERPGGRTRRKKRDQRATPASATHRPPPQGRLRNPPRAGLKPAKMHVETGVG